MQQDEIFPGFAELGLIQWAIKKLKFWTRARNASSFNRRKRRWALAASSKAEKRERKWGRTRAMWRAFKQTAKRRFGGLREDAGRWLKRLGFKGGDALPWRGVDPLEPRTLLSGSISGTLYNDINASGTQGGGESGLAAAVVYLDANNNGSLDSGEINLATDSSGGYQFDNLAAGSYVVRQVVGSGWAQTAPTSNAGRSATVVDNQTASGNDFGARFVKIVDDGDASYSHAGTWINYGAGYQGDEKYIATGNGSAVAYWNFTNLEPGIYQVAATWPVYSNQPTNAAYQLTDVDESRSLGTAYVNQALSPASSSQPAGGFSESGTNWAYLGSPVTLEGANLRVSLNNAANATYMAADAVRIVRVGDLPEEPTSQAQVTVGNSAVTSGTSTVAFGSTPLNQGVAKTVTITNTGTGDLTLGDPSISGASSGGFSIATGLGSHTVAPGQSTTFVLLLNSAGNAGSYSGTVSLTTNDPNHATFTFDVTGTVLTTAVIDNGDSGYSTVGSWTTYAAGYQNDEQYIIAGNGSATANWTFTNLASGKYRVSATWPAYSNQPADAPFTIKDAGRNVTLAQTRVNQSVAPNDRNDLGAWWEDLAIVSVDSAGTLVITLSNDASPIYLAADAVRLERVGDLDSPASPILRVNDGRADVTSATTEAFGETSLGANISKTLTITNTGFADLTLGTLTLPSGFIASAPGSSTLAPGVSTVFTLSLDGSTPGNYSGEVSIASNAGTLTFNATGTVIAASVIDDGESGFSTTGSWTSYGAGFRGDERYIATGNGSATANWTFGNLAPGTYRVSATWPAFSNQPTNAVYLITDLGDNRVAGAAAVNQKLAPSGFTDLGGTWQDLATTVYITGSSLKVTLSNQANGTYMAADAVRLERVGDLPATAVATLQVLDGIVPAVSGSAFDLGTTTLTSFKTKSFTIRNTGLADLALGTLTPGMLPSGFSVATAPSSPLAPGASTTLTIRLDGSSPGSHSGNLTLTTNDPNAASFQLALSGTVSPALAVDDGDANFTTTGTWINYPVGYQGDEKYIATTSASGSATATANWTFNDLPAGMYRISATWPAYSNQPANAPFTVRDGDNGVLATAIVDQSHVPGYMNGTTSFADLGATWQDLASSIAVSANGTLKITLGNNATGTYMAADAVRIERVGDLENPAPPMPTIGGLPTNGTWHIGEEITLTAVPGENTQEGVIYEWLVSEESESPSEDFEPGATPSIWQLQSLGSTLTFTPTVRAVYNVTLTAKLEDATTSTDVTPIEVIAPPEIAIVSMVEADIAGNYGYEGDLVSFESVITNDYGIGEFSHHWLVTFDGQAVAESDHPYLDMLPGEDGEYLVSLTIENMFGDATTQQTTITIGDTAPALAISGAGSGSGGAIEGEAFLLDLLVSDPGDDAITLWSINWGDGSEPEVIDGETLASGEPIPHVYAESGPFTITATAENEDGEFEPEPLEVTVENAAPTAEFEVEGSPTENDDLATFIFSNVFDTPNDLAAGLIYSIDFGDGVIEDVDPETRSITHQYMHSGNYTAVGTISDSQGGAKQYPANVTVADTGPDITLVGESSVSAGSIYTLDLTWGDVISDGVLKWTIDWGDGQTSTVAGARNPEGQLLATTRATHTYLAASGNVPSGQYLITVSGKNLDATGVMTKSVSVVNTLTLQSLVLIADQNPGGNYYHLTEDSQLGVVLNYQDPGTEPAISWKIDWGDNPASTPQQPIYEVFSGNPDFVSHAYAQPGFYNIHAVVSNGVTDSNLLGTTVLVHQATFGSPSASNVSVSGVEGQTLTIPLANSVSAVSGQSIRYYAITSEPSHGTAKIDPTSGVVTYIAEVDYVGSVSIGYTVYDADWKSASASINASIAHVNRAPYADPARTEVTSSSPVAVVTNVLPYLHDADGDTLTVTNAYPVNSGAGTVTWSGTTITYTPNYWSASATEIVYTVSDGHGGTATGALTAVVLMPFTPSYYFIQDPAQEFARGGTSSSFDMYFDDWRASDGSGTWLYLYSAIGGWAPGAGIHVEWGASQVVVSALPGFENEDFIVILEDSPPDPWSRVARLSWSGDATNLLFLQAGHVSDVDISGDLIVDAWHTAGDLSADNIWVQAETIGDLSALNDIGFLRATLGGVGAVSAGDDIAYRTAAYNYFYDTTHHHQIQGNVQSIAAGGKIAGMVVNGSIGPITSGDDIHYVTADHFLGDVHSGGSIVAITSKSSIEGDITAAGNISTVTAAGSIDGKIEASGSIGNIDAAGDVSGRIASSTGSLGNIHVIGSIDELSAATSIGEVRVEGDITKSITAGTSIQSIFAGGSLSGDIHAGTTIGAIRTSRDLISQTISASSLGTVTVDRDVSGPITFTTGGSAAALSVGRDILSNVSASHNLSVVAGRLIAGDVESTSGAVTSATAGTAITGDILAHTTIGPVSVGRTLSGNLNPSGSGDVGPISIQTAGQAPTALTAYAKGFDRFLLLWEDQSVYDPGYTIEYTSHSFINPSDSKVYPDWSYVTADKTTLTAGPDTTSIVLANGVNVPAGYFASGTQYFFRARLSGGQVSNGNAVYAHWSKDASGTISQPNFSANSAQLRFDGLWDFGFDQDQSQALNLDDTGLALVKTVTLTVPAFVNLSKAKFQFDYNTTALSGTSPSGLRLWKSGGAMRAAADYVDPAIKYSFAELGGNVSNRTITLYVQALSANTLEDIDAMVFPSLNLPSGDAAIAVSAVPAPYSLTVTETGNSLHSIQTNSSSVADFYLLEDLQTHTAKIDLSGAVTANDSINQNSLVWQVRSLATNAILYTGSFAGGWSGLELKPTANDREYIVEAGYGVGTLDPSHVTLKANIHVWGLTAQGAADFAFAGDSSDISLGSFIATSNVDPAANFSVRTDWGDGSQGNTTVTGQMVHGTMTYVDRGPYIAVSEILVTAPAYTKIGTFTASYVEVRDEIDRRRMEETTAHSISGGATAPVNLSISRVDDVWVVSGTGHASYGFSQTLDVEGQSEQGGFKRDEAGGSVEFWLNSAVTANLTPSSLSNVGLTSSFSLNAAGSSDTTVISKTTAGAAVVKLTLSGTETYTHDRSGGSWEFDRRGDALALSGTVSNPIPGSQAMLLDSIGPNDEWTYNWGLANSGFYGKMTLSGTGATHESFTETLQVDGTRRIGRETAKLNVTETLPSDLRIRVGFDNSSTYTLAETGSNYSITSSESSTADYFRRQTDPALGRRHVKSSVSGGRDAKYDANANTISLNESASGDLSVVETPTSTDPKKIRPNLDVREMISVAQAGEGAIASPFTLSGAYSHGVTTHRDATAPGALETHERSTQTVVGTSKVTNSPFDPTQRNVSLTANSNTNASTTLTDGDAISHSSVTATEYWTGKGDGSYKLDWTVTGTRDFHADTNVLNSAYASFSNRKLDVQVFGKSSGDPVAGDYKETVTDLSDIVTAPNAVGLNNGTLVVRGQEAGKLNVVTEQSGNALDGAYDLSVVDKSTITLTSSGDNRHVHTSSTQIDEADTKSQTLGNSLLGDYQGTSKIGGSRVVHSETTNQSLTTSSKEEGTLDIDLTFNGHELKGDFFVESKDNSSVTSTGNSANTASTQSGAPGVPTLESSDSSGVSTRHVTVTSQGNAVRGNVRERSIDKSNGTVVTTVNNQGRQFTTTTHISNPNLDTTLTGDRFTGAFNTKSTNKGLSTVLSKSTNDTLTVSTSTSETANVVTTGTAQIRTGVVTTNAPGYRVDAVGGGRFDRSVPFLLGIGSAGGLVSAFTLSYDHTAIDKSTRTSKIETTNQTFASTRTELATADASTRSKGSGVTGAFSTSATDTGSVHSGVTQLNQSSSSSTSLQENLNVTTKTEGNQISGILTSTVGNHGSAMFDSKSANQSENTTNHYVDSLHINSTSEIDRLRGYDEFAVTETGTERSGNSKTTNQSMTVTTTYTDTIGGTRSGFNEQILGSYEFTTNHNDAGHVTTTTINSPSTSTTTEHPTAYSGVQRSGNRIQGAYEQTSYNYRNAVGGKGTGTNQNQSSTSDFESFAAVNVSDKGNDIFGNASITETANGNSLSSSVLTNGSQTILTTVTTLPMSSTSIRTSTGNSISGQFTDTFNSPYVTTISKSTETNSIQSGYKVDATQTSTAKSFGGGTSNRVTGGYTTTATLNNSGSSVSDSVNQYRKFHSDSTSTPTTLAITTTVGNHVTGDFKTDGTIGVMQITSHTREYFDIPSPVPDTDFLGGIDNKTDEYTTQTVQSTHSEGNRVTGYSESTLTAQTRSTAVALATNQTGTVKSTTTTIGTPTTTSTRNEITGAYGSKTTAYTAQVTSDSTQTNSSSATFLVSVHETGTHTRSGNSSGNLIASDYNTTAVDQGDMNVTRKTYNYSLLAEGNGPSKITVTTTSSGHSIPGDYSTTSTTSGSASLVTTSNNRTENATVTDISIPSSTLTSTGNGISGSYTTVATDSSGTALISKTTNQSIITHSSVTTKFDTPSIAKTEGNHFTGHYELTQPLFTTSTTNDSLVTNSLVTSFSTSMHEVSSLATSGKASGNSVTGRLVARTTTQTPSSTTDSQYAALGVTLTAQSKTTATPAVTVSTGNSRTGVHDNVIAASVSTTSLTSLETNVALLGFSIRKNLLTTRETSGTSSGNAGVGAQAASSTSNATTVQTVTTTRPTSPGAPGGETTVATSTIVEAPVTSTSSGNDYGGNFVSSSLNAVVDTVTDVIHTFSHAPNLTFTSHTASRSTSSSYGSGNSYTGDSDSTFEDLGSTSTTTSTHTNVTGKETEDAADDVTITSVSTTVSVSNPSTQTSSGNDIDGEYSSPASTSSGTSTTDTTETNSASASYLLSTHEVASYSSSQSHSGNSVTGDATSTATDSSASVVASRLENQGRLVVSLSTQTAAPSTAVTVQNDFSGDYTTTVASADSSSVSDTTETNAASLTFTVTSHETASSHGSQQRVGNSLTSDYTLTAVSDSSSLRVTNAVNQTQLVITKATSDSDPATAITTGSDLLSTYTTTVTDASSASTTDTTETNSASPTLLNVSRTIVTQTLTQLSTGNQTQGDTTQHSVASDYVSVTTFKNSNNGEVLQGASSTQGSSTVDSEGNSLLGNYTTTTQETYSTISDTTQTNAATPALLIHDVRGGNRTSTTTEQGNEISSLSTTNSYDTASHSILRSIHTGERDTTITGIVTSNQSVINNIGNAYTGSTSGTTGSYDSSSITTVNTYSDGSDTQTAIDTSNQGVTFASNSITGIYSQTTKGDSTLTVTEDGTREETYHQTSKSDSTFTLIESGNSISADQTLTQSSKDHNEVHKTTSYTSTGTTIVVDRTYDSAGSTKDTGNTLTGDYTASATGSSSLTTTETNTSKAGTFGYVHSSSFGSTQTQTGNSVLGDFTHSESQSYSDTLTRTAVNGDTFTQSVSDSPSIMTTGNTVAGLTTATQTGSASYSFTQTTGDYELSGSGLKPYDVISHADANSGLADRTETGTDDYTLIQTGTSGTKAYTLTVTGSDDYSLTTNSNTQDGGFTQSLTATGSYSREEHGDHSGTPYTLSDADDHSFDQLQTGNDVDAQSTQTTTGNTRYDLLIDFTNPVESVTTGEGVTLFMAIGAPQALISDTAAPTGTMSDAGDIDHAYCFAKGMLVLMADASRKPIEEIQPNELVLAVDENDPEGKPKPRRVIQTYHNAPAQIWHVTVNGETIRTTEGHIFHVKGKGWIRASELQSGDELRDADGKLLKVQAATATDIIEPVFNLEVERSHTYFVAATMSGTSIWVHNDDCGPKFIFKEHNGDLIQIDLSKSNIGPMLGLGDWSGRYKNLGPVTDGAIARILKDAASRMRATAIASALGRESFAAREVLQEDLAFNTALADLESEAIHAAANMPGELAVGMIPDPTPLYYGTQLAWHVANAPDDAFTPGQRKELMLLAGALVVIGTYSVSEFAAMNKGAAKEGISKAKTAISQVKEVVEANVLRGTKARDELVKNLPAHNFPVKSQAHHIFGVNDFDTPLGTKLQRWGIKLNGEDNGLWLPTMDYPGRKASLHSGRSTKEHVSIVNERLSKAKNRDEALSILGDLKQELLDGTLKINDAPVKKK